MRSFRFQLIAEFSILLLASPLSPAQSAAPAAPARDANTKSGQAAVPVPPPAVKPKPAPTAKPKPSYYFCRINLTPTLGGLTADAVVPLLNTTDPYTLKARDSASLLVYSSQKVAPVANCPSTLTSEVQAIANGGSHAEEIMVLHGRAMGDVVKAVKALIPDKTDITVTSAGDKHIRLVRGATVSDEDYTKFKEAIGRLEWQIKSESPTARVFYVNASEVSQAVGGKDAAKAGGSDSSDKSGASQTQTGTTTTINQVCLPQGITAGPAKSGANAAAAGGQDSSEEAAKSAQAMIPCSVAPSAAKSDTSGGASDQSSSSLSATAVNDDLLVFDVPPGHDDDISEKKRLLATLDFPRPEVLLNIWSFQTSSSDREEVTRRALGLRRTIDAFNHAIQGNIDATFSTLQKDTPANTLYKYLTQQYVADYIPDGDPSTLPANAQQSFHVLSTTRHDLGLCDPDTYCLGYASLFHPLKPTLTDMLLKVIVSDNPGKLIDDAIRDMEGKASTEEKPYPEDQETAKAQSACGKSELFKAAPFDASCKNSAFTCEAADRIEVAQKSRGLLLLRDLDESDTDHAIATFRNANKPLYPGLPLNCFQVEAVTEFGGRNANAEYVAPRVRLLRAALVNFLFHFKMSQQYPHEFSAYDLSQSAQELNSELNPLIVAFNRDISAMLDVFSHEFDKSESKNGWLGFGGHGSTFINNGVITVRTLSGKTTTVDAVTQNVFDATNPPSITDLINSVAEAEKNVPNVLKSNVTSNEAAAIIGALNTVTPVQSKIGREFKISITPRSLSGASSSELQVNLDAKESAEPTLYGKGSSSSDNISRVADHNVDTKVRLESIKLFEISSFSAYLQRSRRNFPILPPVFELPYIGSILSLPLPGAKEYHRSTAVISAIVVPTAVDIVSGIRFNLDRVAGPPEDNARTSVNCSIRESDQSSKKSCTLHVAISTSDLSPYSISAYHRAKLACIATGHPFPGSDLDCEKLRLSSFFPEF